MPRSLYRHEMSAAFPEERAAERKGFAAAMLGKHQNTNPYFEAGVMSSKDSMALWRAWLHGWSSYRLKGKCFPEGVLSCYIAHYASESREYAEERAKIDFYLFRDDCDGAPDRKTCYRAGRLPDWLRLELADHHE